MHWLHLSIIVASLLVLAVPGDFSFGENNLERKVAQPPAKKLLGRQQLGEIRKDPSLSVSEEGALPTP